MPLCTANKMACCLTCDRNALWTTSHATSLWLWLPHRCTLFGDDGVISVIPSKVTGTIVPKGVVCVCVCVCVCCPYLWRTQLPC